LEDKRPAYVNSLKVGISVNANKEMKRVTNTLSFFFMFKTH